MQHLIDLHHLLGGIRCTGLLSVTECGICNIDLFRHVHRNFSIVISDLRDFCIREQLTEKLRLLDILQCILVRILFQKIALVTQRDIFHVVFLLLAK